MIGADHFEHSIRVTTDNPDFSYELTVIDRKGNFTLPHQCDEWDIGRSRELSMFTGLLIYAHAYRANIDTAHL
jgi:hypothetical protein